jgi:hypothetical protein
MPLFDAKILESDFDGANLLASVLYATPQAKADARSRGLQRLAHAGLPSEASASRSPETSKRNTVIDVDQIG